MTCKAYDLSRAAASRLTLPDLVESTGYDFHWSVDQYSVRVELHRGRGQDCPVCSHYDSSGADGPVTWEGGKWRKKEEGE